MWKAQIPLWVVRSQSAVFLLSSKGDSSDVLAPLTPTDPTVQLNTGWPLGDDQREGWQCSCIWLLTTASWAKPFPSLARVKSGEECQGKCIVLWMQRDNWTYFWGYRCSLSSITHLSVRCSPPWIWCRLPSDIHCSVCLQSIWCLNTARWSALSPKSCHRQGHPYDCSHSPAAHVLPHFFPAMPHI